jgi:minor extracellular serine protease Vpr
MWTKWFGLLLMVCAALAGADSRHYIVELTEPPAADAEIEAARGRRDRLDAQRQRVWQQQRLLRKLLEREDVTVLRSLDTLLNGVIVEARGSSVRLLESLPGVKAVHRSRSVSVSMDKALELHEVPEAWWWTGPENAGAGVKIAIIDSGIDTRHPAFASAGFQMPPGYPRGNTAAELALTTPKVVVYRGYDSLAPKEVRGNPEDCLGHGTPVAACAGAVRVHAPAATISGVAPASHIGAYKVFPGCYGCTDTAAILAAFEDAVKDGMQVVNLSLGHVPGERHEVDLLQSAADRAAAMGVMVISSLGNSGPDPGTAGGSAKSGDSSLGVGASENGRALKTHAEAGGLRYPSVPGSVSPSNPVISAPLIDTNQFDQNATACNPLPGNALHGSIAFILRGGCNFTTKLSNAKTAGAVAALLYSDDREPTSMDAGDSNLPGMMITNAEGQEILAKIPSGGTIDAVLDFRLSPVAKPSNRIAGFSSRGPASSGRIKPDMVAIGESIYTANSKFAGGGENGYKVVQGTSFSSPVTAGAAAVLMGARPRLSVPQYKSLLTNTADLLVDDDGRYLPVMHQGAGRLNLARAMVTNVTAWPVSVSFGANPAGKVSRQILISNAGLYPDSFAVTASAFRPPRTPTVSPASFDLGRGQAVMITVEFDSAGVGPGIYEGYLVVQGSRPNSRITIPYWMGVSDGKPAFFTEYERTECSGDDPEPNEVVQAHLRINDRFGIAQTDRVPVVGLQEGNSELLDVGFDPSMPEILMMELKLGDLHGWHCLNISIDALATTECFWIENPQ